MVDVIFWGGTGQAKVLYEAVDGYKATLSAIVDNRKLEVSPIPGVPLLHGYLELDSWLEQRKTLMQPSFVVAIGGQRGQDRLDIMDALLTRDLSPMSVVHKTAFVANNSVVGEGSQILAMAAICANTHLGRGVIVNTAASVDHDCILGHGVHIAPGARLAGEVIAEDKVFVGTGAIILPRIRLGENAIIGAGAVVTKDVSAGMTVVGNPARVQPRDS